MTLRQGSNLKRPILILVSIILIVGMAGVGAAAMPGRYVPTHKITEEVYCGSCHEAQVQELNETTHLAHFTGTLESRTGEELSSAGAVSGGCMMCHNNWDKRERLYVKNWTIQDTGNGYYNASWASVNSSSEVAAEIGQPIGNRTHVEGANGNYTRFDVVWENLSARSPRTIDTKDTAETNMRTCGEVQDALTCHGAASGVVKAAQGDFSEVPGQDMEDSGVFFEHDMGSPRQTASNMKYVKMCGSCHYKQFPPTRRNGTPMASALNEDFHVDYNITEGEDRTLEDNFTVYYRDNSWTHGNVQCIDCHSHAGSAQVESSG